MIDFDPQNRVGRERPRGRPDVSDLNGHPGSKSSMNTRGRGDGLEREKIKGLWLSSTRGKREHEERRAFLVT